MHAIVQFAAPKVTIKARDGVLTVKLKFPNYDGLGSVPMSELDGALELD